MKAFQNIGIALAVLLLVARVEARPPVTVQGIVVDDVGRPLPGAVVVLSTATGSNPRETMTDMAGAFSFRDVPEGPARVHVELAGFLPADLKVSVADGRENTVTARLMIGFADEVTVSAESGGGVLAPARNADSVEFDSESLRRLPTDAQDVQSMVEAFTPAGPVGGVSLVVDGVETDGAAIPAAAIHRIHVNRSPYAAEFKSPGKSRVEVETDHGSRRFYHGSGGMFVRNSALQASPPFAIAAPDVSRALNDGTIGGPLLRRKWSFFASGQRLVDHDVIVIDAVTLDGPLIANAATAHRRALALGRADFRPNDTDALTFGYDVLDDVQGNRGVGGLRLADRGFTVTDRRQRFQVGDRRITAAGALNDLRIEVSASGHEEGGPARTSSVIVAGAFASGPSPTFSVTDSHSVQVQDVLTASVAAHAVRVGARVRRRSSAVTDGSNFGGTYQFRSLTDYAAGQPFLLIQRTGNADVSLADLEGTVFAETDFRPWPSVGVTAGIRYDWQARVKDWNNIAPRISAAFAPADRHLVVRAGFGRFFQSVPQHVLTRARLFGDDGLREDAITAPPYPAPMGLFASGAPSATWRLAADVRLPTTTQASVAIERPLARRTIVAAEYMHAQTSGALRTSDVNAPRAIDGRPDPTRLNVFEIGSTGSSRTDALTLTARSRVAAFRSTIQYTLGTTIDDGSGALGLPASSNQPASERGRADFDQRHRLSIVATYGWLEDRIRLGGVFAASSGAPYDIETGADDNHDLVVNDRPAGVTRNSGDGPGLAQLDLRMTTVFRAPRPPSRDPRSLKQERIDNLEVNLDVFNVFNRVNATSVIGVVTSPIFGRPDAVRMPRTAQLSLRYRF